VSRVHVSALTRADAEVEVGDL
jgi:hypothetical protein